MQFMAVSILNLILTILFIEPSNFPANEYEEVE